MIEKKKQEIPVPFELDDFFKTQNQREDDKKEKIEEIDISLIDNFKDHPFKVQDNDELKTLEESIKTNGLLEAVIIREKENGRYEMISGHRRLFACKKLGLEKMQCRIKDLTDDEATIFMVDSNIHRERLLPSEKAFAYKLKMQAIKHQGARTDLASSPLETKLSAEVIGKNKDSRSQVFRYIRLTELIPEILKMVDNEVLKLSPSMAFRPAVEISYLTKKEQTDLLDIMECNDCTPSLAQAIKLKNMSLNKILTIDAIEKLLNETKPNQILKIKINEDKLRNVIPKNIEPQNVEDFVLKACEYYTKHLKQKDRGSR